MDVRKRKRKREVKVKENPLSLIKSDHELELIWQPILLQSVGLDGTSEKSQKKKRRRKKELWF